MANDKIEGKLGEYRICFDMYDQLVLVESKSVVEEEAVYRYFERRSLDAEKDRYICLDSRLLRWMANVLIEPEEQLLLRVLQLHKDKYIFIDNADTILTPKLREYIANDMNNKYILFGSNVEGLWINENRDAELIKDEERKEFRLHYRFKRENLNAGL